MPEKTSNAGLGVITDGYLRLDNVSYPVVTLDIDRAAQLLQLAVKYDLQQIWVFPKSELFKRIQARGDLFLASRGSENLEARPATLRDSVIVFFRGRLGRCQLVMPGISGDGSGAWAPNSCETTSDLYSLISLLRSQLGFCPSGPVSAGKRLVESTATEEALEPCAASLRPFAAHSEHDLIYERELEREEETASYLHVIDKRAMYLSSLSQHFGRGTYMHLPTGRSFSKFQPGLWRVQVDKNHRTKIDEVLPGLIRAGREQWLFTPMVQLLIDYGYAVSVSECYVWFQTGRPFDGLYKTLRKAMQENHELMKPRGNTPNYKEKLLSASLSNKACKQIYTRFIGWLAHKPEAGRFEPFYRPDWRSLIISEAKARIIRNAISIYEATGLTPAGVNIDGLFYFTDHHAAIFSEQTASCLKQFKRAYSVEGAVAAPLFKQGLSIVEIHQALMPER